MAHCAICRRNNIPDHVADRDGIDECAACTLDDYNDYDPNYDEYDDPYDYSNYDEYDDPYHDGYNEYDDPSYYDLYDHPPIDPIYLGM